MKYTGALLLLLALGMFSCGRPIARFTYHDLTRQAPDTVKFMNQSQRAESYKWDFGDGQESMEAEPTNRYTHSGNYVVRLTAMKGKKKRIMEKRILISPPDKCLVEIETRFGNMLVELYDETPQHRDNFLKLAEEGYFDGMLFHRVIDGFMVQGGDPDSKNAPAGKALGMGGPGYQVPAEFNPKYIHIKGALAAARQGDQVNPEKKSSGSQFYIVQGKPVSESNLQITEARNGVQYTPEQKEEYMTIGGTPFLDQGYTVFGQVIEGLDVIDSIATVKTDSRDRPLEDVAMKIRVIK
ncbi:MAG: peptidylprolyl isomerase [Saprospiraceae bacterium]